MFDAGVAGRCSQIGHQVSLAGASFKEPLIGSVGSISATSLTGLRTLESGFLTSAVFRWNSTMQSAAQGC